MLFSANFSKTNTSMQTSSFKISQKYQTILLIAILLAAIFWLISSIEAASSQHYQQVYRQEVIFSYLVDEKPYYSRDEIARLSLQKDFKKHQGHLTLPIGDNGFWFHIALPRDVDKPLYLLQRYWYVSDMRLYRMDGQQLIQIGQVGNLTPLSKRNYPSGEILFPIPLGMSKGDSLYIFATTLHQPDFGFEIVDDVGLKQYEVGLGLFTGFVLGGLSLIFIYNFLLNLILRQASYTYYLGYLAASILTYSNLLGFNRSFVFPNAEEYFLKSTSIYVFALVFFCVQFTRHLLKSREYTPRLDRLFRILLLAGLLIPGAFWLPIWFLERMSQVLIGLMIVLQLPLAIIITKKGYPPAKYYLTAWGLLLIFGVVRITAAFGWLPLNTFYVNAIYIGALLEILLLSFALASQINQEKQIRLETEKKLVQSQARLIEIERQSRDILAQKVEERTKQLNIANQTKDKFFSIISHDLRGPAGSLAALLTDVIEEPKHLNQELLEILRGTSQSLYSLLEQLLVWSQSQQGSLKLSFIKMPVSSLLQSIAQILDGQARQKEIKIEIEVDENLSILADHPTITTVTRNLVGNAIKFSPPKSRILIKGQAIDQECLIEIIDEGVGIDEVTQSQLFNIVNKIQPREGTNKEKGSGFGLILCAELVGKNRGKIGVNSKLGEGSRFWITLPLEE